jgi:hypothetical protein
MSRETAGGPASQIFQAGTISDDTLPLERLLGTGISGSEKEPPCKSE